MSTPPLPPTGPDESPEASEQPIPVRWSATENAWVTSSTTPDVPMHGLTPRVGHSPWFHLLLFLVTFITMTGFGATFFHSYVSAVGTRRVFMSPVTAWLGGLWFSIPALLILTAHEFGHYFACRYYRIPASLPYFIPLPFVGFFGTLGAVIRMAMPGTRRALFDVGIAGPIAGFVVLVPLAIYGVTHSFVVQLSRPLAAPGALEFGDPLLLTLLQRAVFGTLPDHSLFVMHPVGFGVWFGLLATALNLFPAGQLDGGHIVHALIGKRSRYVTIAAVLVLVNLAVFVSYSWGLWTVLLLLMTYLFGLDHPPVGEEHQPIGTARVVLGVLAIAMFVLSFTPVPISPIDFVGGR